jgi:hypothetical protein
MITGPTSKPDLGRKELSISLRNIPGDTNLNLLIDMLVILLKNF